MKREQKGYITKIGGYWCGRLWAKKQVDGEARRVRVTHKIAPVTTTRGKKAPPDIVDAWKAFLRKLEDSEAAIPEHHRVTVGEFVERKFLPDVEVRCRRTTFGRYRSNWQLHISRAILRTVSGKPFFRDFPLKDVLCYHIQNVLDSVAADGVQRKKPKVMRPDAKVRPLPYRTLGENSLKGVKTTLSALFAEAIRLQYHPGGNPCQYSRLDPRAPKPGKMHAYTEGEITAMLAILPEPAATAFAVAAYSGLRMSEIEGLRWEDIRPHPDDLERRDMIWVTRAILSGRVVEPKTEASKAPVPVIPHLKHWLDAHRERMGNPASGPVFSKGAGKYLSLNNLSQRLIRPVLDRCLHCGDPEGVPHLGHSFERDPRLPAWHGWHACRRGLASVLVRLGASDLQASQMLRHTQVQVTRDHYIKQTVLDRLNTMAILEKSLEDQTGRHKERIGHYRTLEAGLLAPPKTVN